MAQETAAAMPETAETSPEGGEEKKRSFIGGTPRGKTYSRVELPTAEQIASEDFMNNCATRGVLSLVMGGGMGMAFGIVMTGFRDQMDPNAGAFAADAAARKVPMRQVFLSAMKQMGQASISYGKTFAVMGALYATSECAIESYRAKHDLTNTAIAGCFTGGALAYGGGPQAMCLGCATFGAFSVMIDRFMERE